MLGPGVPADRRSWGFLLRPPERTFPFRSLGPGRGLGTFLGGKAMPQYKTFPFMSVYGNAAKD
jgi:hypothetical protein